ncbi:MAG: hypothetical protein WD024_01900 [Bacillota bacterium]
MREVQEPIPNKPLGLRSWLIRPLYVKNLLYTGYVSCLAVLALAPVPRGGLSLVFFAAVCFGVGTVSALVFSPDANQAGSRLAAFFLAFVMHGLVAATSIHGGYYPRTLAGGYAGQAISNSAWFAILEWGAIMALGRLFATTRRPTVPLWVVASAPILLAVVIVAPEVQGRGYRVAAGQPPVRYSRFSDPTGSAEPATALLDGIFVQVQTDYDRKTHKNFSVLKGCDIKGNRQWTMDVFPSTFVLPWAFLALGEPGELLVVHETGQTNEAGDRAVWVTKVDIQSATKGKPEFVVRAPWLDPDASAVLLNPGWQRAPLAGPAGVSIDVDEAGGLLSIRGSGFRWELWGDPESTVFILGEDVVVMRETRDEGYSYHVFLLPSPP